MQADLIIAIGAVLLFLGFSHLNPSIALLDARIFRAIHKPLRQFTKAFQVLWHLGRTPFTVIMIALSAIYNLQAGLICGIAFVIIASTEWLIKRSLQRTRPYHVIPDAVMTQPKEPHDPSFPSGDAMRIWYLALCLPMIFGLPWQFMLLTGIVALIVTLGRIAMGVHYPLDTIAGTGLAIIGLGLVILIHSSSFSTQLITVN